MNNESEISPSPCQKRTLRPVLVVVEGVNDIEYLRRLSAMLHDHDERLPDLGAMEREGRLAFVPFGGGDVLSWTHRLAPLACQEFHLLDREMPPETELRQTAAERINARAGCLARLTQKRSLENYLHPAAIRAAGSFEVEYGDFDAVGEVIARKLYEPESRHKPWDELPRRRRKQLCYRVKRWLNTHVVECMTPEFLAARDSEGEIAEWMMTIARMAEGRA